MTLPLSLRIRQTFLKLFVRLLPVIPMALKRQIIMLGPVLNYPWTIPKQYWTFRKLINYYLAQISWLLNTKTSWARPYQITLELTNICNLRCPHCPTGQGLKGRKPSMMPLEKFKKLLKDLGPYAVQVDLHNWGESLLHKEAFEAIRLCEEHNIRTTVCTNFNIPFDEEKAEALVRSNLSVLSVSIDGPDQETYETYRVRGNLQQVLDNVELLQAAKKRLNTSKPLVIWSYLVFRFNQHRVEETRELAKRYDMVFSAVRGYAGFDPNLETSEKYSHPALNTLFAGPSCKWLYSMAVINADLGVSPCCIHGAFDQSQDFGQVRDTPFEQVWNGSRYRSARQLFKSLRQPSIVPQEQTVCEKCPAYIGRKKNLEKSS